MTTLLLIAHPGHELRALRGWSSPTAGGDVDPRRWFSGAARLADSRAVLDQLGVVVRDDWLPAVSDQLIYQALLGRAPSPLPGWLEALFDACWAAGITTVVADEAEGYNPSHDLCRVLANRLAARLASAGHPVLNLELPLVGHPSDPQRHANVRVQVQLTPAQTTWKLNQMRDYARRCSPVLETEVQKMIDDFGAQAFATECLYDAARTPYEDGQCPAIAPHFEQVGEARHAAGVYRDVIRSSHLLRCVEPVCGDA